MEVTIRSEHGYDLALYGFSLSYKDRAIQPEDWWCSGEIDGNCYVEPCDICKLEERKEQIQRTATANAGRGKGHDKFLRQIVLWVDISAPRYWWSEFDTYKVGTTAQSESTMHTLSKRDLTEDDFEVIGDTYSADTHYLDAINKERENLTVQELKSLLPESYLQRRLVTLNYAVLRCIIEQRKNHKLPEWSTFINEIYRQVQHPELLQEIYNQAEHKELLP